MGLGGLSAMVKKGTMSNLSSSIVHRRFEATCRLRLQCDMLGVFYGPEDGDNTIAETVGEVSHRYTVTSHIFLRPTSEKSVTTTSYHMLRPLITY
jgi:hypothetical protein